MSRFSSLFVAGCCAVLFGQGCSDPVTSIRTVPLPSVAQPLHQTADDTRLRVESILGIVLPSTGVAVFRQSSIPKQEGPLFYGPAFRLTVNEKEYDRKLGDAFVLNITDPTREPQKTLREPLQRMLGCVEDLKTYGPRCEIETAVSSTENGLRMNTYPIRYERPTREGTSLFVTSTAWLIQIPENERAWLYVLPKDLGDVTGTALLAEWVSGLR